MAPRRSSRRRAATTSSSSSGMDVPETLSSFTYYRKDGSPLNVDIKMGSLLDEKAEAIAFTVDNALSTRNGVIDAICKQIGNNDYIRKMVGLRRGGIKHRNSGVVEWVDVTDFPNPGDWKYLLLCVVPEETTLMESYTNILRICNERKITTVTVVGLGCGQIGISARTSAKAFIESIMNFDAAESTVHLTNIAVLDVQRPVVNAFIAKLNEYVADLRYIPENKSKLVCMDNHNLLDYEARSFSTPVTGENVEEGDCIFCLDELGGDNQVCALKCNHQFHFQCFKNYLNCMTRKCCPICRSYFSVPCGNQPTNAKMYISTFNHVLEGYEESSTRSIEIQYSVPGGVQDETHLRPGLPFRGTTRVAYLPDNDDGRKVLRLFKKAFECRLIFTVGDSVTTGVQNVVTWNCIHHKTNLSGGAAHFGFPDPTYIVRVLGELEEAGITEDLLTDEDTPHPQIHDRS